MLRPRSIAPFVFAVGSSVCLFAGSALGDAPEWQKALLSPPTSLTQVPFWFWNDDLDPKEIKRQMADFRAHGVYGFVIHARMGIPKDQLYMGPHWLACVKAAVEEAARTGMVVHLYDEGMYPSGSAHGEVVRSNPDFAARGLVVHVRQVSGPATVETASQSDGRFVAAVVAKAVKKGQPYDSSTFKFHDKPDPVELPAGRWAVLTFLDVPSKGRIRGVHEGEEDNQPGAPKAADLLNPEAMAKFIELTHDVYYRHLKRHFGKTVKTIFTDEPSLTGRGSRRGLRPWTTGFAADFQSRKGYDIRPLLPALWFDIGQKTGDVRRDHQWAIAERLDETYYKPLSDWAAAHNVALTGHPSGSDESRPLRWFQWPGQDIVWRWVVPNDKSMLEGAHSTVAKCASSVARHDRRPRCGNEMLGAYQWHLTFDEVKWLTDWLMVRGTDLLWPHAFYYSVRDYRMHERPPDVGPNNLWWPYYKLYADYTRRISWILTDADHICDVAVLGRDERLPWKAPKFLYQHQYDFNYLEDFRLIGQSAIKNGRIIVGPHSYSTLVVEGDLPTGGPLAKRLADFRKQGGCALQLSDLRMPAFAEKVRPDLRIDPPNPDLRYRHMKKAGVDFYLISNEGESAIQAQISVAVRGRAKCFDPWTGRFDNVRGVSPAEADGMNLPLDLGRREALILCVDPGQFEASPKPQTRDLDAIPVKGPWEIVGADGKVVAKGLGDWLKKEATKSTVGTLTYKTDVTLAPAADRRYLLDAGTVGDFAVLTVNGQNLGVRLWAPYHWDVTGALRDGKNVLELAVTNSRVNQFGKKRRPSGLIGPVVIEPQLCR